MGRAGRTHVSKIPMGARSSSPKRTRPMRSREPARLHRGKVFQRKVQADWLVADHLSVPEKAIRKPSGRRGRIDVFVDGRGSEPVTAIVEVKASDWDLMTAISLR